MNFDLVFAMNKIVFKELTYHFVKNGLINLVMISLRLIVYCLTDKFSIHLVTPYVSQNTALRTVWLGATNQQNTGKRTEIWFKMLFFLYNLFKTEKDWFKVI